MSADRQAPSARPATASPYGAPPEMRAEHPFFPVSATKFVLMSIVTFTLYILYWSYKNWSRIKERSGESISPFWRSFFMAFWAIPLCRRIKQYANQQGIEVSWSPEVIGFAFLILLVVTPRLPDPWWLVALGAFVPILPVLGTIDAINAREPAREGANNRFSGANIVTIILMGLLLVLAVIGTFLPDPVAP